jgi:HK97 gp10 family phage protein
VSISVRVEGMSGLRRALLNATKEGTRAVQIEVLRSALRIQARARERCPVDTGRLRNSIAIELDEDRLSGSVGTNVDYAPYVEFGTVHMAAQPYLFPSIEEEQPEFIRRLREQLGEAFVKASR